MSDLELETWKFRIEASARSERLARFVFAVLTIASVAVSIAGFNFTFSWTHVYADELISREQAESKVFQPEKPFKPKTIHTDKFQDTLVAQHLKNWVDSHSVHIPLLGISILSDDLPLLGSIALLVICIWFYYCCRRENHAIYALLHDAREVKRAAKGHEAVTKANELCRFVFQGIAAQFIFMTLSDDDDVRDSIERDRPGSRNTVMHLLLSGLFYLPAAAIFWVGFCDILTFSQISLFRPVGVAEPTLWGAMSENQRWHVLLEYLPTFLFFVLTTFMCRQVVRFNEGTRRMLQQFRRDVLLECVCGVLKHAD